jgi:hypothetical protein
VIADSADSREHRFRNCWNGGIPRYPLYETFGDFAYIMKA